jgi:hypothetical protein
MSCSIREMHIYSYRFTAYPSLIQGNCIGSRDKKAQTNCAGVARRTKVELTWIAMASECVAKAREGGRLFFPMAIFMLDIR